MSGPKSSVYELTVTQQMILAEQRRIEIERQRQLAEQRRIEKLRLEEVAKYNAHKKELTSYAGRFTEDLRKSKELFNRTKKGGEFATQVEKLEKKIKELQDSTKIHRDMTLEVLRNKNAEIIVGIAKIKAMIEQIKKKAKTNNAALLLDLEETIAKGFTTSFAELNFESIVKEENTATITEMLLNLSVEIQKRQQYSYIPQNLHQRLNETVELMETIEDKTFLKNFGAVSIIPLLKECDKSKQEYEKWNKEYEILLTKYQALCQILKVAEKETACNEESVVFLKNAIKEMENILSKDNEQRYISDCIDEVMEEMGYDVIGSREVTKKNGKHFRNELYTYGEGTAVSVTYSSDGRIAMELGGIDSTDRLPNDAETSALCDSMEQFCGDFKEIEKRLLAKGVVLVNRISLLPPNAEYAQIINTTDYKMTKESDKLQIKKKRQIANKGKQQSIV